LLQPGNKMSNDTPANYNLTYDHFTLSVEDGLKLDAYFIVAQERPKANLIMLHGVGSCKEVYLPAAAELSKLGYNILLFDQRQHGKSEGEYLTYGYYEKHDVSKALDWLVNKTNGLKTGIYGNSMGGAVALQSLAHDARLRFGLIESTFTDLPTVANAYGRRLSGLPLPYWLSNYVLRRAGTIANFPAFSVRPVDAVTTITQPIQLIHGDADANINVNHAYSLFGALAAKDKQLHIVKNGDHADLWEQGGASYQKVWFGFLKRMLASS
ncbi:MAG: alpha/beta fold hydrolase, partial [Bacteroidota bacterium]